MSEPLKIAVAGIGRMGLVHLLHVHELARDTGGCELVALADPNPDRVREHAAELGIEARIFSSVEELAEAKVANATVLATPTSDHRAHVTALIRAGQRVLVEKPLTMSLEEDRDFCDELDRDHPNAVMVAFQRRFDGPLAYAKELAESGVIGRVFKIHTAMEDSGPAPNGYKSGGILVDMSIHNVDEVLWFTGQMPARALAAGANLYSHAHTTADEDYDDALLYLWFPDKLAAQIQVGRNHVSGYRVESVIYGEEGQIHVGRFDQKLFDITVEAYGRRGREEPIAHRVFPQRRYGKPLPEFIDRFGAAYKAEVAVFMDCCTSGAPFPVNHRDSLRAQQVIAAGLKSMAAGGAC